MTTTTTARMLNFGAGPAMLPAEVWEEAGENLLSFAGSGVGIAELSHRSPEYGAVHADVEARIRALLGLDDDWAVLFMTGGASSQAFVAAAPAALQVASTANPRSGAAQTTQYHIVLLPLCVSTLPSPSGAFAQVRFVTCQPSA